MNIVQISNGIARLRHDQKALAERVDYLTVAVARGDPRFTRAQYAVPGFDCDGFDEWWRAKGKRVPDIAEIGA